MDVACDACCIINFLAAGNVIPKPHQLTSRPPEASNRLFLPTEVIRESLYLLQPDPSDPNGLIKTKIDFAPYFDIGLLHRCQVETVEENGLFVKLASTVDDGEAACLAIAKLRGMTLASDDRLARRIALELGVPVINTAQYVYHWAHAIKASREEIVVAIQRIQRFARFLPRIGSESADWWFAHAT
ncbi:MAG: hypothetical protein WD738_01100 [Pirellulales bacterium]